MPITLEKDGRGANAGRRDSTTKAFAKLDAQKDDTINKADGKTKVGVGFLVPAGIKVSTVREWAKDRGHMVSFRNNGKVVLVRSRNTRKTK